MTQMRHYARAAAAPAVIAVVARALAAEWDPQGEFVAPDGERTPDAHARAVLGILGTGPDTAAVMGYLRRAEVATLGTPRTTGVQRQVLAEAAWRAMVEHALAQGRGEETKARAT